MALSVPVPQQNINGTIASPLNFGAKGQARDFLATINSGSNNLTVAGLGFDLTSDHEGLLVAVEKAGPVGSGAVVWVTKTTAGNPTVELTSGTASPSDEGQRITINMAGPDTITEPATITGYVDATHVTISPAPGTTLVGAHTVVGDDDPHPLVTTIASVTDATHCVLAATAQNTVSGTLGVVGKDEIEAFDKCITAVPFVFVPDDYAFIVRGPLVVNKKLRIYGGGRIYFLDDGLVATNCQISIADTILDGTFLPYSQQTIRYVDTSGKGKLACERAVLIAPKRAANDQPTDEAQYWEGVAVFAHGSTTSFASRITFSGCQIFSGQNGLILDYGCGIKIIGCEFYTQSSKALTHILCAACRNYTITGNDFQATDPIANASYNRVSSFMGDQSVGPRFATISNNSIKGTFDFEAILLFTAQNCAVTSNVIEYEHTYNNSTGIAVFNLSSNVDVSDIVITSNVIKMPDAESGGGVYGIICSALLDGVTMRNLVIANNTIITPGHGIFVSRTIDAQISHNDVTVTGGIPGRDGILLIFGTGTKINGGQVRGASAHGININTSAFEISHITVSGCAANGIFLPATYGADSYIYDCRLNNNEGYGISIQSTEPNLHVERNKYSGNALGEEIGYNDLASLSGNYENHFRTNKRMGVGVVPQTPVHILSPSGTHAWMRLEGDDFQEVDLRVAGTGGSATAAILSGKASRGTTVARTAAASGDEMIRVEGRGYDGAAYRLASMISQVINGTVSSGIVPGRIDFLIADLLGAMKRVLRMDDTVSLLLGETNNCRIVWGNAFPVADAGSILLRTGGGTSTSLYNKTGGNGTNANWEPVLTVSSGFAAGPVRFNGTNLHNPTTAQLRSDLAGITGSIGVSVTTTTTSVRKGDDSGPIDITYQTGTTIDTNAFTSGVRTT